MKRIDMSQKNDKYLYEIAKARSIEFCRAKPNYIKEASIYPIIHDNTEDSRVAGWIEVSLDRGDAFASYNLIEISSDYNDEKSCEDANNDVCSRLIEYVENELSRDEINSIWQYVDSGNLKWHEYVKYSLEDRICKEDRYGLYDAIRKFEEGLCRTKPDCIKEVKLLAYFTDLGINEDSNLGTLLINIDAVLEKENEYHRFIWTSTSDGYGEDNRKEEIENSLMGEMKDILEHDNPDDFWEESSWNECWEPMPQNR